MPCFYFCRHINFFTVAIIIFAVFSSSAHSAEWHECEKAKLRELKLQHSSKTQESTKRKSHRRDESHYQSAEEIDTWLWKNCREFSYELRQLEQDKM